MKQILAIICTTLLCTSVSAAEFKIATFNIKWFGIGGEMSGKLTDEFRGPWIKELLKKNYSDLDGILFQEIVNVDALKELMSELDMSCYSYRHNYSKHQHIALCLDNEYEFNKVAGETNYIYEEVANAGRGRLRPALYGVITKRSTDKDLFTLTGVHLKASKDATDVRLEQVELIKSKVNKLGHKLPHVILGDWNSHQRPSSSELESDVTLFEKVLSQVKLERVKHQSKNTFRNNGLGLLLDHAWVSHGLEVSDVQVWKACNISSYRKSRFDHISFYNRFISDHCPLSFKINL